MPVLFQVFSIDNQKWSDAREDLRSFMWSQNSRFSNGIHAEVHVYTARASLREPKLRALHWHETVEDETLLGRIGWCPDQSTIDAVERELLSGHSVRFFGFNSDSDVIFENQLVPAGSASSVPPRA